MASSRVWFFFTITVQNGAVSQACQASVFVSRSFRARSPVAYCLASSSLASAVGSVHLWTTEQPPWAGFLTDPPRFSPQFLRIAARFHGLAGQQLHVAELCQTLRAPKEMNDRDTENTEKTTTKGRESHRKR